MYLRPKYAGIVEWWEDVPLNLAGISEMESDNLGKHVTFLF